MKRMRGALPSLLLMCMLATASAQDAGKPKPDAEKEKTQLRGIETEIERSTFEQRRLGFEIETLSSETESLRKSLIDSAAKLRAVEERVSVEERKLADVTGREAALRRSLQARERITTEVLAAMQRIGRKPPPALLVAPEDALDAVRAAILFGALLPELRDEAMILIADLRTLVDLRREVAATTGRVVQERDGVKAERTRLASLVEARQDQLKASQGLLDGEKSRSSTLAREARSLRDLISRTETEIIGNTRATEFARRAPAPAKATDVASLRLDGLRDATRLQPRRAFAEAKGHLPLPVNGNLLRRFGQPDGIGGTERGMTLATAPDAVVTAPVDGIIQFAAPYRGYGQLLILNAGNGYHMVLAGLGRLAVEPGQFVLAGEPLGFMGRSLLAMGQPAGAQRVEQTSAAPAQETSGKGAAEGPSSLYIEFRKDGSPVDPSPWWVNQPVEKARG